MVSDGCTGYFFSCDEDGSYGTDSACANCKRRHESSIAELRCENERLRKRVSELESRMNKP